MNDPEVQRLIDDLDAAIPKDGARLEFSTYGHPDGCEVIANKRGYLRAGIELLKAGVFPLTPERLFIPADLEYLFSEKGSRVARLTRDEDVEKWLPSAPPPASIGSKLAGVGCLLVFVLLAGCSIVGIIDVLGWLFRK
jgi:hypothetical protein